jgi:glycerol-3-phosphate cytidylyltransferase-like family protein
VESEFATQFIATYAIVYWLQAYFIVDAYDNERLDLSESLTPVSPSVTSPESAVTFTGISSCAIKLVQLGFDWKSTPVFFQSLISEPF